MLLPELRPAAEYSSWNFIVVVPRKDKLTMNSDLILLKEKRNAKERKDVVKRSSKTEMRKVERTR